MIKGFKYSLSVVAVSALCIVPVSAKNIINFNDIGLKEVSQKQNGEWNHYIVKIADANKTIKWSISKILPPSMKNYVNEIYAPNDLNNKEFAIDINEKRLNSGEKDSIHIYPLSNGAEADSLLSYMATNKKGLYLTLKDNSYSGRLEDINFQSQNSKKNFVNWNGIKFDCSEKNSVKSCSFYQNTFQAGSNNPQDKGSLKVENLKCFYSLDTEYIGSQSCSLDNINFNINDDNGKEEITLNALSTKSDTKLVGKDRVESKSNFSIDEIKADIPNSKNKVYFDIKNISIAENIQNISRNDWDTINQLSQNPEWIKDKKSLAELAKTLKSPMDFLMLLKIASVNLNVNSNKKEVAINISNYNGKYNLKFGEFLKYDELTQIDGVDFLKKDTQNIGAHLRNFKFGWGIDKIYNALPELLTTLSKSIDENGTANGFGEEQEKEFKNILQTVVNKGIEIHIAPISIESLKFDNNMLPSFGPDSINLKAQLKANSMTLDNPMATMMLLGLLNGEGEIVLPVQDFQTILSMIPPKMANMARMLAKKEGNNIVYKIKYQNGGLTVNGMPMM